MDDYIVELEDEFDPEDYGAEPEIEQSIDGDEETPEKKTLNTNEEEEEEEEEYEEIPTNKNINIISVKKTQNIMTIFEFTRLISERAKEIENNMPVHPEVPKELINSLDIAEYELIHRHIPFPFYILRPVGWLPRKQYERWQARELILPSEKDTYGL
jgi:DNA-directed RNA polymerase subunit K/omega